MTDWTELKRLAEEAGGIEWHADMAVANDGAESRAIYHRPKPYHVVEIIETPDSALDNADCIHSESVWQFIAAANPKTILALIAENERLRADGSDVWGLSQSRADIIDQLRAEVEALRSIAIELRGWISCQDVNHRHGEFHEAHEPCKVLARIDSAISKAHQ